MDNLIVNIVAFIPLVFHASIPIVLILAHRFMSFWRTLGRNAYYVFILMFFVLDFTFFGLALKFRDEILSWRIYDTPWALFGILLVVGGLVLGFLSIRALSFRVLMGVPEIFPGDGDAKLTTTAIYNFIRHPRYLEFVLEVLGIAVLSGLIVNFIILAYFFLAIFLAARLEERELIGRFGDEYLKYKNRTGGFLPKMVKKKTNQ